MGPAKYDESSTLWQVYNGTTLAGSPLSGKSLLDTTAVPSWYPYYYRATVIGEDDPPNGAYRGESPYSSIQTGYTFPAGPPLILSFSVTISAAKTAALIKLTTDLPAAAASPVGAALIELLQLVREGSPPGPLTTKQRASMAPNLIPVGSLSLPLFPASFDPLRSLCSQRKRRMDYLRSSPLLPGAGRHFCPPPHRSPCASIYRLVLVERRTG